MEPFYVIIHVFYKKHFFNAMLVKTTAALHRGYSNLQIIFSFLSRGELLSSIISNQINSVRLNQQVGRSATHLLAGLFVLYTSEV
jgi:hypothetical protein